MLAAAARSILRLSASKGENVLKPKSVATVVFSVVVGLVLFSRFGGNSPTEEFGRSRHDEQQIQVEHPSVQVQPVSPKRAVDVGATGQGVSYSSEFRKSHNYLRFISSYIKAAQAGDPDAQYYVGRALGYCNSAYNSYFRRLGKRLTMDEGLLYAAELSRPAGLARSIYERCHDLEETPSLKEQFGIATEWISSASSLGQPAAQAEWALEQMESRLVSPAAVTSLPRAIDGNYPALLMAAVQTRDPEALFIAASAQALLHQNDDANEINQYAWWLVSCEEGYDCSSGADWIEAQCPTDRCAHGLTGLEFIQWAAGDQWVSVERRAQEIEDGLNSKDWDKLGLTGQNSKFP